MYKEFNDDDFHCLKAMSMIDAETHNHLLDAYCAQCKEIVDMRGASNVDAATIKRLSKSRDRFVVKLCSSHSKLERCHKDAALAAALSNKRIQRANEDAEYFENRVHELETSLHKKDAQIKKLMVNMISTEVR